MSALRARELREPFVDDPDFRLFVGDVREVLAEMPDASVDCCVTSPPYWGLRDYGTEGQLGLERTPDEYAAAMVDVFGEVRRVLTDAGTLWLNLGDTYAGSRCGPAGDDFTGRHVVETDTFVKSKREGKRWGGGDMAVPGLKPKDLVGIPWLVAFALRADGWWLRAENIWNKTNAMPESVKDRPTRAHEQVFLLTKSARYFYDGDAIREEATWDRWSTKQTTPKHTDNGNERYASFGREWTDEELERYRESGRNARSVWAIPTRPYADAHFAVFPEDVPEKCILAGCPVGGTVLDPFMGSGTTALVARRLGRKSVGIELNPEYAALAAKRLQQLSLLAEDVA